MARTIKVEPTSRQRIQEMNGFILLSYAKLNDAVLVTHSYIVDEDEGIVRRIILRVVGWMRMLIAA
jgi:hypothetical protein